MEFSLWWFLTATGNLLPAVTIEMFLEQECVQAEGQCQKGKGKSNLEIVARKYCKTWKDRFYCREQGPGLGRP